MDPIGRRPWPLVTAAAAVAAIAAVSALFLSRETADRILLHDGRVAQEFLNSIVAADASGGKLFDAAGPVLDSFASHAANLPGIVRANIYSPDGFIRYSTEPNLIGLKFVGNEELAASFAGELISKLAQVSDDDKPEHLALNRLSGEQLVEAYIPVSGGNGRIAAVVEFYKKPAAIKAVIADLTRLIWITAALGAALSILVLTAVWRGRGR